jgi:hypothetical protein
MTDWPQPPNTYIYIYKASVSPGWEQSPKYQSQSHITTDEQTTTKTLLPTVLLLLPSFQALQFQYIILILCNLDDYTCKNGIFQKFPMNFTGHIFLQEYWARNTINRYKKPNCTFCWMTLEIWISSFPYRIVLFNSIQFIFINVQTLQPRGQLQI